MIGTVEPVFPQQRFDLPPDDRFVPRLVELVVIFARTEEAVPDFEARAEVLAIGPNPLV